MINIFEIIGNFFGKVAGFTDELFNGYGTLIIIGIGILIFFILFKG